MITIERAKNGADAFMRIHNRDGGEVDACGNATRCVGWLLMGETGEEGGDHRDQCRACSRAYDTGAAGDDHGRHGQAALRLERDSARRGIPRHARHRTADRADRRADPRIRPRSVNMGNPHAIFWVDDVEAYDLVRFGPLLENHPIFPERANISLAHVTARDALTVRTWERGVGLTRACGTAACAAAVAAMRKKLTDNKVTVTLPGGAMLVEWRDDGHVWMTGPVESEFEGRSTRRRSPGPR